jgi:hypothetical protein
VIGLATVAALAVAAGGAVAVSARDGRAVALGLAVAMAAAPFAASPLPSTLSLAARIVGALLGAFLLWAAARAKEMRIEGTAIGLAAQAAVAATAFVIGLWIAPVKPLPGPVAEQAAGLALVALAVVPLTGRDVLRAGIGATLLALGLLLLHAAWLGPGLPLEHLAQASLLVGILGATSLLIAPPEVAGDAEPMGATEAEVAEEAVAGAADAAVPPRPSLRAGSTLRRTRHPRADELRR